MAEPQHSAGIARKSDHDKEQRKALIEMALGALARAVPQDDAARVDTLRALLPPLVILMDRFDAHHEYELTPEVLEGLIADESDEALRGLYDELKAVEKLGLPPRSYESITEKIHRRVEGPEANAAPETKMFWAAKQGDLDWMKDLEAQGVPLSSNNMAIAADGGHYHIIYYMYEKGQELPALSDKLNAVDSVTEKAVMRGDVAFLAWQKAQGVDYAKNRDLLLLKAISNKQNAVMRFMIEECGADYKGRESDPAPIEFAFRFGNDNPEAFYYLLGLYDRDGIEPDLSKLLVLSAEKDNLAVGKCLLERGADPNEERFYRGCKIKSVLMAAVHGEHYAFCEMLAMHGAKWYPGSTRKEVTWLMQHGLQGENFKLLEKIHQNSSGYYKQNRQAWLLDAVEHKRPDVLKFFIEHVPYTRDSYRMPLQKAVTTGDNVAYQMLKDHLPDSEVEQERLMSLAFLGGNLDIVKDLVDQGVKIGPQNFSSAIMGGHIDMVDYGCETSGIVLKNLNMNLLDSISRPEEMRLDMIRYLHEAHELPLTGDLVHHAAEFGRRDILDYAKAQGYDQYDTVSEEALQRASSSLHLPVLEFMHETLSAGLPPNQIVLVLQSQYGKGYDEKRLAVVDFLADAGGKGWLEGAGAETIAADQWRKLSAWRKRLPDKTSFSQKLLEQSPLHYNHKTYEAIRPLLTREGYEKGEGDAYAYSLAALFKSEDRVLQYLEKWGGAGKQPLHDLAMYIAIPKTGEPDLKAWGDAVLAHGPKMARLVKFADKLAPQKNADGTGWSYTKTEALTAQFAYPRAQEHPKLATLCHGFKLHESTFNAGLAQIAKYQERYAGNDNKKVGRVPQIDIDGALFGKPEHHFYKLADGDIRGLLLGEFTDCCQHIGGQGAACAEHGFLSMHAAFYVVAHKTSDEIIGQSWAWRGNKGALVLDSLETLGEHMDTENWKGLCDAFGKALEESANKCIHDVPRLHVGTGGATPEMGYQPAVAENPCDYEGYRDSHSQRFIWGDRGF